MEASGAFRLRWRRRRNARRRSSRRGLRKGRPERATVKAPETPDSSASDTSSRGSGIPSHSVFTISMALILQEGVQDSFLCFYPGTVPFPEAVDRRGHGEVAQDAHDKTAADE